MKEGREKGGSLQRAGALLVPLSQATAPCSTRSPASTWTPRQASREPRSLLCLPVPTCLPPSLCSLWHPWFSNVRLQEQFQLSTLRGLGPQSSWNCSSFWSQCPLPLWVRRSLLQLPGLQHPWASLAQALGECTPKSECGRASRRLPHPKVPSRKNHHYSFLKRYHLPGTMLRAGGDAPKKQGR